MEILNKYLHIEGIDKMREWFLEKGILKHYTKGEYFVRQGELCSHAGYIQSGSFRYVKNDTKRQDQIVGYSFENDFVVDYAAFQLQVKSVADTQAIKDSVVFVLSHSEVDTFFVNCKIPNLRSLIAETFFFDIYNRMLSLYCDSPEERYIKLIHLQPEMLNQVSLREIASFIKVTPETLSRIRRKIIFRK